MHAQGRFRRETAKKPNSDVFVFRTDRGEVGKEVSTNANLAALIGRIGAADPSAMPLESAITNPRIGEAVPRLFLAGSLSLQTEPFRFALTAGKCPAATALARVQASRGDKRFFTLRHTVVEIADPAGRHLITLLDGTRTRRQL